jgi:pyruvate dehydrogenase E2 component (dihydrolipoamide acetyltransferase)
VQDVAVPDIGSSGKAKIIELLVKVGDTVEADQSLLVLESDKASMEIPSPAAGVVESLSVKLDDEVGTGDPILKLRVVGAAAAATRRQRQQQAIAHRPAPPRRSPPKLVQLPPCRRPPPTSPHRAATAAKCTPARQYVSWPVSLVWN